MYLSELDLQYLTTNIQAVCSKPVFIVNLNWKIMACTLSGPMEYAEEIPAHCAAGNDCQAASEHFGIQIEPCLLLKHRIRELDRELAKGHISIAEPKKTAEKI